MIAVELQPAGCDGVEADGDAVDGDSDDDVDGNSLFTSLEIENCVDCSMSTIINTIPLLSLIIFQVFIIRLVWICCCGFLRLKCSKCDFLFSPLAGSRIPARVRFITFIFLSLLTTDWASPYRLLFEIFIFYFLELQLSIFYAEST